MSNVIQIKHGQNAPADNLAVLQPYELGIVEDAGINPTGTQYVKLVVGADGYDISNLDGSSTKRYYKDLYVPLAARANNATLASKATRATNADKADKADKANDKYFCRFQGFDSFKIGSGSEEFHLISLQKQLNAGGASTEFESTSIQIDNNTIGAMKVTKRGVILLSASVQMLSGSSDDSGVYLYVYRNGEQIELCTSRALLKDAGALTIGMYIYEAQENDVFFIKAKNSTGVNPGHVSTYLSAALFEV